MRATVSTNLNAVCALFPCLASKQMSAWGPFIGTPRVLVQSALLVDLSHHKMPAQHQSALGKEVPVRSQVPKTELCRFFSQKKGCRHRSSSCPYAHGEDELQERPNLLKTSLCRPFLKGNCVAESGRCEFAHGHRELRKTSAFEDPPKTNIKKHVRRRLSRDTSKENASLILLIEALDSACFKMNTDKGVNFGHSMPLCTAASKASDVWKDLETLLVNSKPEFYED